MNLLTPIMALQASDPVIPWRWQTVFVPVGLGLLCGICHFSQALYPLRKHRLDRRLRVGNHTVGQSWRSRAAIYADVFRTCSIRVEYARTPAMREEAAATKPEVGREAALRRVCDARCCPANGGCFLPDRSNDLYATFI